MNVFPAESLQLQGSGNNRLPLHAPQGHCCKEDPCLFILNSTTYLHSGATERISLSINMFRDLNVADAVCR